MYQLSIPLRLNLPLIMLLLPKVLLLASYINAGDEIVLNEETHTKEYSVGYSGTDPFYFLDSGGQAQNYKEHEDYYITFTSENGLLINLGSFEFEHEFSSMYDRLGIQVSDEPSGHFYNLNRKWMLESSDSEPPWTSEKSLKTVQQFDKLRRDQYSPDDSNLEGYLLPANHEEAISLGFNTPEKANEITSLSELEVVDASPTKTTNIKMYLPHKAVRFHFISDYSQNLAGWDFSIAPYPEPKDTDGDTLSDDYEINFYNTDPNSVDTDADGLNDFDEIITYGSNPQKVDSDSDGLDDYAESKLMALSFDINTDDSGSIELLDQAGFISEQAIGELRVGATIIPVIDNQVNIALEFEESTDLNNWMSLGTGSDISFPINGDRKFYRIKLAE